MRRRGLSARWWGALSGAIIAALLLLVGGLTLLNATRPNIGRPTAAGPTAVPTLLPLTIASPAAPTAGPPTAAAAPSPTAAPPPSPTATPAPRYAKIANTSGLGANLRRDPSSTSPPVAAVAENGVVKVLGPEERAGDGRVWRRVEDNRGTQGWVPAEYLADAAGPNG